MVELKLGTKSIDTKASEHLLVGKQPLWYVEGLFRQELFDCFGRACVWPPCVGGIVKNVRTSRWGHVHQVGRGEKGQKGCQGEAHRHLTAKFTNLVEEKDPFQVSGSWIDEPGLGRGGALESGDLEVHRTLHSTRGIGQSHQNIQPPPKEAPVSDCLVVSTRLFRTIGLEPTDDVHYRFDDLGATQELHHNVSNCQLL